ncbi:uncharacterized protein LOC129613882 [Condylostylus longicornis]|uniref:uncharacterized protein LOC129613882 n=1 Tax=Condylostylus longicornis TaxID=2530218 RepID=UPI00244DB7DD|nr:uncharacterized protein LOC129613882 [Condylostylus longicornis]
MGPKDLDASHTASPDQKPTSAFPWQDLIHANEEMATEYWRYNHSQQRSGPNNQMHYHGPTRMVAGKMFEIADELMAYSVNICSLQEIRWKDQGEVRKRNYSIYLSGNKQTGYGGTGFYIDKKTRESVILFEPINDRMCYIKLKGRFQNISIVSVYAPKNDTNDEIKDEFYDKLDTLCSKISRNDLIIIMGDFNAKIGREDFVQYIGGRHSLHKETNENGMRICNFAMSNRLHISSISFPHKNIHKHTWKIPGRRGCNQIDHVLVDKRHATSITDVSDFRRINWNSDRLIRDDITCKKYQQKIVEKLNMVRDGENMDPTAWNSISKAVKEAAEDVIGKKQCKRNEWYDEECRKFNDEKNKARKKLLERPTRQNEVEYKEKRKLAKKVMRTKKKEAIKVEIRKIEENHDKKNIRNMYSSIKKQTSTYQPRWKEHFDELLNRQVNENCVDDNNEILYYAENIVQHPTLVETKEAIKKLKNGKAGGEDNLTAELIKYGGEELHKQLHELILSIWNTETLPTEWMDSIIFPIHKKGDKTDCNNYRGISLLNIGYKIFTNIVYQRVSSFSEEIVGDYQAGFRKDRSTSDQCFILSQIFEKAHEYSMDIHCLFIDFKQAFDSLDRSTIEREGT